MDEVPSSGSWMRCQAVAHVGGAKQLLMDEVPSSCSWMRCQVVAHG